jgi:hypothetical protein
MDTLQVQAGSRKQDVTADRCSDQHQLRLGHGEQEAPSLIGRRILANQLDVSYLTSTVADFFVPRKSPSFLSAL